MGESDERISPAAPRSSSTPQTTARFNVYYGEGRDAYDVRGRVAHEIDLQRQRRHLPLPESPSRATRRSPPGRAASPGSCCGYRRAAGVPRHAAGRASSDAVGGTPTPSHGAFLEAAPAAVRLLSSTHTADRRHSRTGTPARRAWRDWATSWTAPADPFNEHEPVDSSAAAIAAQGLLRPRAASCAARGETDAASATGRPVSPCSARSSTSPTSATDPTHQGLLLHSVYHRPNGWDYIPPGRKVPCGESSMWGDYHLRRGRPPSAARHPGAASRLVFWRGGIHDDRRGSLENRGAHVSGAAQDAEPRRRRLAHPGEELLHGSRDPRPGRRAGALAQP